MLKTFEHSTISTLLDSGEFVFFKWKNRPNWPVAFVSSSTTQILGYTPESFRNGYISYSDIIHPHDLVTVMNEVQKYSETNQDRFTHKAYRIVKKNGSIIWVHDSTRIIRDTDGSITHYVGYIVDITSLKHREILLKKRTKNLENEINMQTRTILELNDKLIEDVRTQKTLYEELFNSTNDGIVIFKDKSIIEYNRAILNMMNCDNKKSLQKVFLSFFKDSNSSNMKKIFTCANNENLCRFDWKIELNGKESLWAEVTFTPMKIQNDMVMHSHWRDITKRKNLEQINKDKTHQLIQQSRFAQMGEMISMIAHQWRQPLSVISATTLAMQMKLELDKDQYFSSNNDKKLLKYLINNFKKINNSTQYMSQTIDDFRYFFKPHKKATKFYISDAYDQAQVILEQNFKNNKIKVELYLEDLEPIYSFENEIIQVFINLLKNAKDALVENKISDPLIEISISSQKQTQSVKISDNAGGIKNDKLDMIFDPYYSTKSKNGTGLGLYMSKMIIEEHCHGEIIVTNIHKGACFEVILPKKIN